MKDALSLERHWDQNISKKINRRNYFFFFKIYCNYLGLMKPHALGS